MGELERRKNKEGAASIVPAEEREWPDDVVTFDSAADADNPKNWPFARKVAITMLFGLTTMCAAFASSVFAPASAYISRQYGVSQEVRARHRDLHRGVDPRPHALPFVAAPLFHDLGVPWACTVLGCISVALAFVPFLFYVCGAKLRAMSRMAQGDPDSV